MISNLTMELGGAGYDAEELHVPTAVILAGGLGTGMFPWGSMTPNKAALPIPMTEDGNPVLAALVDSTLRECLDVDGLDRIVIVTTKDALPNLRDYLGSQTPERLNIQLPLLRKDAVLGRDKDRREERASKIKIRFAIQPPGGYGTAAGLAAAMPKLQKELATTGKRTIVMNGDDIIHRDPTVSSRSGLADAIERYRKLGANRPDHLILGLPVARNIAHLFGVLIEDPEKPGYLKQILEKPAEPPEDPEINIGRYVLDLNKLKPAFGEEMAQDRRSNGQEHLFTTVIDNAIAEGQTVGSYRLEGAEFLDCGKPGSYIRAVVKLALATGLLDKESLKEILAEAV